MRGGSPEPAMAGAAARRVLADYLRLIRGRRSARTLSDAAPELRRVLRQPTTIRAVEVTPRGQGSVRATATLQDAGGPQYTLLLYLERRGAYWLVTRIGDA